MERNTYNNLPKDYSTLRSVNLKKSKGVYLLLVVIALTIACIMVEVMSRFFMPLSSYFEQNSHWMAYGTFVLGALTYIALHETIHTVMLKRQNADNTKIDLLSPLSYPKSSSYLSKQAYITTALTPLFALGLVLILLNIIVPARFFWLVYMLQVLNVVGSIPDVYVAILLSHSPFDTLILCKDSEIGIFTKKMKRHHCNSNLFNVL